MLELDGVLRLPLAELLGEVLLDDESDPAELEPEMLFVSLDMLELLLRVEPELFISEPLWRDAAEPDAVPD